MKTKEEIQEMIDKLTFEEAELLNERYCNTSFTSAVESALKWVIGEKDNLEDDIKEAHKN